MGGRHNKCGMRLVLINTTTKYSYNSMSSCSSSSSSTFSILITRLSRFRKPLRPINVADSSRLQILGKQRLNDRLPDELVKSRAAVGGVAVGLERAVAAVVVTAGSGGKRLSQQAVAVWKVNCVKERRSRLTSSFPRVGRLPRLSSLCIRPVGGVSLDANDEDAEVEAGGSGDEVVEVETYMVRHVLDYSGDVCLACRGGVAAELGDHGLEVVLLKPLCKAVEVGRCRVGAVDHRAGEIGITRKR